MTARLWARAMADKALHGAKPLNLTNKQVDWCLDAIESELPLVPEAVLRAGDAAWAQLVVGEPRQERSDQPAPPAGPQLSREALQAIVDWFIPDATAGCRLDWALREARAYLEATGR